MSKVEVIHTNHINPANLKGLISDLISLSDRLTSDLPEEGLGWAPLAAAVQLRKYNDILEKAYLASLEDSDLKKNMELVPFKPVVTQTHDETTIDFRNRNARYRK